MNNVSYSKIVYAVFNERTGQWLQDDEGMDFYYVDSIFSARNFLSSERAVRYINKFLDHLNEYIVYYKQNKPNDDYAEEAIMLAEQYKDVVNLAIRQVVIEATMVDKPLTFEFMIDKLQINSENL